MVKRNRFTRQLLPVLAQRATEWGYYGWGGRASREEHSPAFWVDLTCSLFLLMAVPPGTCPRSRTLLPRSSPSPTAGTALYNGRASAPQSQLGTVTRDGYPVLLGRRGKIVTFCPVAWISPCRWSKGFPLPGLRSELGRIEKL